MIVDGPTRYKQSPVFTYYYATSYNNLHPYFLPVTHFFNHTHVATISDNCLCPRNTAKISGTCYNRFIHRSQRSSHLNLAKNSFLCHLLACQVCRHLGIGNRLRQKQFASQNVYFALNIVFRQNQVIYSDNQTASNCNDNNITKFVYDRF